MALRLFDADLCRLACHPLEMKVIRWLYRVPYVIICVMQEESRLNGRISFVQKE
jgi:hypothetical protein